MPIDFEGLKAQGFIVREKIIAGEKCYLVFPSTLGIKWTSDNLIYRSSIWTADGRPVSLGFKKFFNYGEASHIVPDFTEQQIKDHTAIPIEKIDGSCLIVSRFGGIVWGELIVRTRGTFDASEHEATSHEIEYLKKKYPKAFDNPYLSNGSHSYIYEWTTRNNPIVVDYGPEPDIRLIGVINHKYYTYTPQVDLPQIAMDLGLRSAAHGKFESFDALKLSLADMRKAEGYCIYYNNDQDIKKIKCDWYQAAHKFRSQCTLDHVLDLYISWLSDNYPSLEGFVKSLETAFDFECSDQAKEYASRVDVAYMESLRAINGISKFVDSLSASSKEERKAAAEAINKTYALENKAQFAFTILNKQPLSDRQIKKLIEQQL
jgi:hypothetical protein